MEKTAAIISQSAKLCNFVSMVGCRRAAVFAQRARVERLLNLR
jgi:hypothetical protein